MQGVGFRWWTRSQARELRLRGWVRNDPDGTVAVLLHGQAPRIEKMVARLREGPSGARVASVEPVELTQSATIGFEILH